MGRHDRAAANAALALLLTAGGCGGEPEAPAEPTAPAVEAPPEQAPPPEAKPAPEAPRAAAEQKAAAAPEPEADIGFLGKPERARMQYMREAPVKTIRKGKGGRSLLQVHLRPRRTSSRPRRSARAWISPGYRVRR